MLGTLQPTVTDSATATCLRFPVRAVDFLTSAASAVFLTFECGSSLTPEEKQEATVLASHTLPDSLVYGADWSWLLFRSLQSAPLWSFPSNLGTKTADLKGVGELPTPCHECIENNDGAGHARPQSGMKPLTERMRKNGTWLQATAATTRDCGVNLEEADSTFSLLATCSFYDHALHLWEWEGN
ncbi:diphthine methyltransferase-like [Piliocolobus tephrosceles]|uniref:diphthine methyltransferase-like n=1 Tax=Piliocolobus tephrosceles TaxID=591936 RepID=UPI000E6B2A08|nr:diphthine methyltransferase-like [Piliocolobus tephrosceles]